MAPRTDLPWEEAVRAVIHGMPVIQAAKKFQVCRSGLYERLNGNIALKSQSGSQKLMSPDDEDKLLEIVAGRSQAGEGIENSRLRVSPRTDLPWEEAVRAVVHGMPVTHAAKKFQVCRSGLYERLNGNVALNGKAGMQKYMTPNDEDKVLEVVTARSQAGECTKKAELREIIRQVALSARPDEIPDTFPNDRWIYRFILRHKSHFPNIQHPVYERKRPLIPAAEVVREVCLRQTDSVGSIRQSQENVAIAVDSSPTTDTAINDLTQNEQISQRLNSMESKLESKLAEQKQHSNGQVKRLKQMLRDHQQIQQKQHMQLLTMMQRTQQIQQQQAMMLALVKPLAPTTSSARTSGEALTTSSTRTSDDATGDALATSSARTFGDTLTTSSAKISDVTTGDVLTTSSVRTIGDTLTTRSARISEDTTGNILTI